MSYEEMRQAQAKAWLAVINTVHSSKYYANHRTDEEYGELCAMDMAVKMIEDLDAKHQKLWKRNKKLRKACTQQWKENAETLQELKEADSELERINRENMHLNEEVLALKERVSHLERDQFGQDRPSVGESADEQGYAWLIATINSLVADSKAADELRATIAQIHGLLEDMYKITSDMP